jgi:prevent-host-death family protein
MMPAVAEVNVHHAKTHLSKLLQRVAAGEEIVIARGGEPIAKLVPIRRARRRTFGADRGQVLLSVEFDAPLSEFLSGPKAEEPRE